MVLRASQDVNLRMQDTRQIAAPSISGGGGSPGMTVQVGGDSNWAARMLQNVAVVADKLGQQYVQTQLADTYLKGVAQAGSLESEAEIQNDSLTRDWEVAGYRDAMGRLKLAQYEAKLAEDMQLWRQKSPTEFQEYLNSRRAELLPQLEGMSREARSTYIPKLALADHAAIQQHKSEHIKFVSEQEVAVRVADLNTRLTGLRVTQAGADVNAYAAQVQSAAGSIVDAWASPRMAADMKQKFTTDWLQRALAEDHVGLYQYLRDTPLPDGTLNAKGEPNLTYILDKLTPDQQEKLATQAVAASQRNVFRTQQASIVEYEVFKQRLRDGDPNITMQDVTEVATRMRKLGIINSQEQFAEPYRLYLSNRGAVLDTARGSSAWLNGQGELLRQWGITDSKAAEYAMKSMQGDTDVVRVDKLSRAVAMGTPSAAKPLGDIISGAMANLVGQDGKVNTANEAVLSRIHSVLDTADPTKQATLLAGLGDDNARLLLSARAKQKATGKSSTVALQEAMQERLEYMRNTPAQNAAAAELAAKDDEKYFAESPVSSSLGFFGRAYRAVKFLSEEGKLERDLSPASALPQRVQDHANRQAKLAYNDAIREARLAGMVNPEARHIEALRKMQASSVRTPDGTPLYLPIGTSPAKFFGLPDSATAEDAGAALARFTKPSAEGNAFAYTASNGRLFITEYDKNGTGTGMSIEVDPKEVRQKYDAIVQERERELNNATGFGKKTSGVRYNGENTAGIDPRLTLQLRDTLVQFEAVKPYVYDDKTGKRLKPGDKAEGHPTFGVGIKNEKYWKGVGKDWDITPEIIDSTFKAASNDAAISAAKGMQKFKLRGPSDSTFVLFGNIAYHAGEGWHSLPEYQQVFTARSADEAVQAFKSTAAYSKAGNQRKQFYMSMIRQSFGG